LNSGRSASPAEPRPPLPPKGSESPCVKRREPLHSHFVGWNFSRVVGVAILLYEATLWPAPQEAVVMAAIGLLGLPYAVGSDQKGRGEE
jgi:hypothetical protein